MTDLDRLIAAVEAGEFPGDVTARDLGAPNAEFAILTFYEAFSGSLDAALALKEALLPGWRVGNLAQASACPKDSPDYWTCRIVSPSYLDDCEQAKAIAPTPARALLLATLRAYRAIKETKE